MFFFMDDTEKPMSFYAKKKKTYIAVATLKPNI